MGETDEDSVVSGMLGDGLIVGVGVVMIWVVGDGFTIGGTGVVGVE